ncbi:GvpL/GvpF family gas vesicle protein [Actinoallomurus sp. CA-142502]|uniref:GvpL/GvpF family gas vesicle protein n=1 Tax=Actinoallomurus sp. CA-142502 TaxID=3239885 RepID=UPI003D93FC87
MTNGVRFCRALIVGRGGQGMHTTGAALGARLLGLTRWMRPAVAPVGPAPELSHASAVTCTGVPARTGPPARTEDAGDGRHEFDGPHVAALRGRRVVAGPREAEAECPDARVCYVYGVVPASTRLPDGLRGTGGGRVRLVRCGDLAAVISEIPPTGALGTREELLAHENVVASLAAHTTMLPLRFSAVVTTAAGAVEEMLEPYYDWFTGVLAELEGRAEYSVSGIYVQDTVLREVLAEEPEVMRLRDSLRGLPDDAAYHDRVRLGELIVHALDAKREADTDELVRTLSPHAVSVAPRPPVDEDTAADAAFLVADGDRASFRKAVDELGYRWAGRIRLRVQGPLAPYDFVPSPPDGRTG